MVNKKILIALAASILLTGCVPYGGFKDSNTKLATETKVETPKEELPKTEEVKEEIKTEEVKQEAPKMEKPAAPKKTVTVAAPKTTTQTVTTQPAVKETTQNTTPTDTVPDPPPTTPEPPAQPTYTIYDFAVIDGSKVIKNSTKFKVTMDTSKAVKRADEVKFTVEQEVSEDLYIYRAEHYGGMHYVGGSNGSFSPDRKLYTDKVVVQGWNDENSNTIDCYIFVKTRDKQVYEYKFTLNKSK